MNELTPYEQLLAAKLDQVPVPDMADGIWSAIEMQLDAAGEVPSQEPAAGLIDRKSVSRVKASRWYVIAGIVAVVIVLWWYLGHKRYREPVPFIPLPQRQAPLPAPMPAAPAEDSPASDRPVKKKSMPFLPAGSKNDTLAFSVAPTDTARAAPLPGPAPPPVLMDSPVLQTNRPLLPDVDLYRSAPPAPQGRKPRGVKGLTDDDYKLTATKDTMKKKH